MLKLAASRLAALMAVMLAVSVLVFAMGSLIPGDMTSVIVGQEGATKEQFDKVRRDLGLDRPLPVQYLRWLGNALQGDLGKSPITGRQVSADLTSQIPVSLELALLCLLLSTLIGLPAGIVAAVHANRKLDVAIRVLLLLIFSVPTFVIGIGVLLRAASYWLDRFGLAIGGGGLFDGIGLGYLLVAHGSICTARRGSRFKVGGARFILYRLDCEAPTGA